MKVLSVTKEKIKEIAKKAVEKLQDAPLAEQGEYIKIYLYEDETIEAVVIAGNSWIPNAIELGRMKFVFPDYDSQRFMEEEGIEYNEENRREWDWNNFTLGEDFNNEASRLEDEILDRINIEYNVSSNEKIAIEIE